MPNDSKQLSYLKRNAARSKDILLLAPNHILAATHDLMAQTLDLAVHVWHAGTTRTFPGNVPPSQRP